MIIYNIHVIFSHIPKLPNWMILVVAYWERRKTELVTKSKESRVVLVGVA